MKILAISGSLRTESSSTALVQALAKMAPKDVEFTIYHGLADLPHFTPDLDDQAAPISVINFRALLQESDGVIICTPEYAYGMPGVLKNALDWTVSSGEFVGKAVATLSSSPSEFGGSRFHDSLLLTLTALSADVVEGASLTIPFVRKN